MPALLVKKPIAHEKAIPSALADLDVRQSQQKCLHCRSYQDLASPLRDRLPGLLCRRIDRHALGLRQPDREGRHPREPRVKGGSPHLWRRLGAHVASVRASAASSSSPMLHAVEAMPAAIAGVTRSDEWIRAKL